jgi:plastocyanin
VDSALDGTPGLPLAAGAAAAGPASRDSAREDSTASGTATTIRIDNFSFIPATTTVPVGSAITWVNADDVPHKIVSSDGKFTASPAIDTNDRYTFRFTQPGRYEYFCALHPKMTGTIEVR